MKIMEFCWVTLPVKDIETSLAFYRGILGLPIAYRHGGEGVEIAMLGAADQPKIELIQRRSGSDARSHSDITVGISVPDLIEAIRYVKAHQVVILRGPFAPNPHISFAYVQDPDGYEVQLVEAK